MQEQCLSTSMGPKQLYLKPATTINGAIHLPGSKSISNRALLLASLANGRTTLTNLLNSDDVHHMLSAMKQLGVHYELSDDGLTCVIEGLAGLFKVDQRQKLFLGNAGTAMRPLVAALAFSHGQFELTGEPRMYERPIKHLVDALVALGADICYLKDHGYPPLMINGRPLVCIDGSNEVCIAGSISSQFLTALLMIAPLSITQDLKIKIKGELVSKPYIDITLNMMAQFGVTVQHDNYQEFYIEKNQSYKSVDRFLVEGDASSASYFLAAGAIAGKVKITGVGKNSIQGDISFAQVLEKMGAQITWGDDYIIAEKPKTFEPLQGIDMDFNQIPDAAMTIATTALFAQGETLIRNVYNWRVKETDRLTAMATELKKVGARVEEGVDYLRITPIEKLRHAEIDTYDDHRMAMCFSLLTFADCGVTINDPQCVTKTFPHYFDLFQQLVN